MTTAQPGWYDAGVPGRERWWDGTQWTPHEREVAAAVPAAPAVPVAPGGGAAPAGFGASAAPVQTIAMGWYPVPGSAEVRWWDGTAWTPYGLRGGRPKPDAFAVEPPGTGITLGILFIVVAIMQLGNAALTDVGVFSGSAVLFLIAGLIWLIAGFHSRGVRRKPVPQSDPIWPDAVRPLPGEVEGPGAGWYPMHGRVTRWWTGVRWSWYVGQKFGVRPGHSGPRGYLVSRILGWAMTGLGALSLVVGVLGIIVDSHGHGLWGRLGFFGVVFGVVMLLLGGLVLLLVHHRRYSLILPPQAPPLG